MVIILVTVTGAKIMEIATRMQENLCETEYLCRSNNAGRSENKLKVLETRD